MEHGSYEVDVLTKSGEVVGKKLRRDIDKTHDIYKAVHILLITPRGEIVLSPIKARQDLPNLYVDQYGTSIASIIRSGEIAEEAARRAASRELFIDNADLHFVGESFATLRDGRNTFLSFFYLVGEPPTTFSQTDITELIPLSPHDVDKQLANQPEKFTPTFAFLWEHYKDLLPL